MNCDTLTKCTGSAEEFVDCENVMVARLQSGAAGCERGFEKCFLRVTQADGLNCSCHAAQASGTFRTHFTKPFSQPAAPDCTVC